MQSKKISILLSCMLFMHLMAAPIAMAEVGIQKSAPTSSMPATKALNETQPPSSSAPLNRPGAPRDIIRTPGALKPVLEVVSATGAVQQNCASPAPALMVTVNVRNSGGGALAASQGTIYVSEDNGSPDRLVSNGVQLPAFAAGETKAIKISVITLSPYSVLAGGHILTVHLLPTLSNGQYSFPKPVTDYTFGVTFPPNFCK
jgi:hypothetical protein